MKSSGYGCRCDKSQAKYFFSDGRPAPCPIREACPTASAEWNRVRAAFAVVDALGPLSGIRSALEELATAPLIGNDRDSLSAIACAGGKGGPGEDGRGG